MIVTEKEAAEMWCPAARNYHCSASDKMRGEPAGFNRVQFGGEMPLSDAPAECRCIGSRCMWWRWKVPPVIVTDGGMLAGWKYLGDIPGDGGCVYVPENEPQGDGDRLGYCGMAGSPK